MATNVFFRNYDFFNEQQLIDDLVIESIQIYGVDTYYITKNSSPIDELQNEVPLAIFDAAYHIDMYVKSVDGFQGEGDFLSKFGLQIRDQVTFTVANRTFERFVTRNKPAWVRPKEGDLIYMPMNQKFFKVTFVEHESVFYQTGALQVFDLKCELYEYSNERFETGVALVDTAFNAYKTTNVSNLTELQNVDPIAKNIVYETEGDVFIDFSEIDPFSENITRPTNYSVTSDQTVYTADSTDYTADTI
jgi:hypothetical protein